MDLDLLVNETVEAYRSKKKENGLTLRKPITIWICLSFSSFINVLSLGGGGGLVVFITFTDFS